MQRERGRKEGEEKEGRWQGWGGKKGRRKEGWRGDGMLCVQVYGMDFMRY